MEFGLQIKNIINERLNIIMRRILLMLLVAANVCGCAHIHTITIGNEAAAISEITEKVNTNEIVVKVNDQTERKGYNISLSKDTLHIYGKNMRTIDNILLNNVSEITYINRGQGMKDGLKIGFISLSSITAIGVLTSKYFNGNEKIKIVFPGMLIFGATGAFVGSIVGYCMGSQEEYIFNKSMGKVK